MNIDDFCKEAILYASPNLYDELNKYLNGEIASDKDKERMKATLTKYIMRMATRCTPFGAFASCGVATIKDTLNISENISEPFKPRLHFRYDMELLSLLAANMLKESTFCGDWLLRSNSSLYKVGKQYRYIYASPGRKAETLEIRRTEILDYVIKKAATPKSANNLVSEILTTFDITREEANDYVISLTKAGILLSPLIPSIIGSDFMTQLRENTEGESVRTSSKLLCSLEHDIKSLNDSTASSQRIETAQKIFGDIKNSGIKTSDQHILQVDSYIPEECHFSIPKKAVEKVLAGLDCLARTTPLYSSQSLQNFARKFAERYESQTVPLLEALDPDIGVGYAGNDREYPLPLLNELTSPSVNQPFPPSSQYYFAPLQNILIDKYVQTGKNRIELDEEDLKRFPPTDLKTLPDSLGAMFRILESDNDNCLLEGLHFNGISAANLLGRFTDGHKGINDICTEICRREQEMNQSVILAEVSHISSPRIGNILKRERMRDVEIEVMTPTRSGADNIPVSGLYVSVIGNRIRLSNSKGEEIKPRLTTAHNFHLNTLPVYQFLCDLQSQGVRAGLSFSWGNAIYLFKHLPRVTYGDIIFARESWLVDTDKWRKDQKFNVDCFNSECDSRSMPQYLWFPQGDNTLFIDRNLTDSVIALFSAVKNSKKVMFEEVISPTCRFNEIILPLIKE